MNQLIGYYSKWINQYGAFIGGILYIMWFILTGAIFSLAIHDQNSYDFFSQPIIMWIRAGPLLIFLFAGQYLFKNQKQAITNSAHYDKGMRLDFSLSLLTFTIWAITNLILTDYNLSLSVINNLIGGLLFSAVILILFGGGGIARRLH